MELEVFRNGSNRPSSLTCGLHATLTHWLSTDDQLDIGLKMTISFANHGDGTDSSHFISS